MRKMRCGAQAAVHRTVKDEAERQAVIRLRRLRRLTAAPGCLSERRDAYSIRCAAGCCAVPVTDEPAGSVLARLACLPVDSTDPQTAIDRAVDDWYRAHQDELDAVAERDDAEFERLVHSICDAVDVDEQSVVTALTDRRSQERDRAGGTDSQCLTSTLIAAPGAPSLSVPGRA